MSYCTDIEKLTAILMRYEQALKDFHTIAGVFQPHSVSEKLEDARAELVKFIIDYPDSRVPPSYDENGD